MDWGPVTGSVPQGSLLGSVLFIIFINDIDVGLNNFIAKFADDTKIGNLVISDNDKQSLQDDFAKFQYGVLDGKCLFNLKKCHSFKWEQET